MINFSIEKIADNNGQVSDAVVKTVELDGKIEKEVWCTIPELDRLFDKCSQRWPVGWDLEKLMVAVEEAPFD